MMNNKKKIINDELRKKYIDENHFKFYLDIFSHGDYTN